MRLWFCWNFMLNEKVKWLKLKVSKAQLINKAQNYIFADTHEEKD